MFHYLRIPDEYGYFQLDVFLLTRLYGVIIEVKNIYGTISFDDMGQMIRTANEIEEGFHNPLEQIAVQEYRLRKWLKQKRYSTNDRTLREKVIHEAQLLSKLEKIANKYEKTSLNTRQWNKLTEKLIEAHTEQKIDILNKYGIHREQLLKGMFCYACKLPPMVRIHGGWKCTQCGEMSPDAHMAAFKDYYLLHGNMVRNREAREFLNVTYLIS
ncbi:NERD domain-containing protein [Ornithinibacillus massiliensis]|uniref:NERD domain-containing protein n=1 Tax=Ornithinibacillus massiliensis TaxID=1944633 RepID=A0ABS5MEC8_9BACI|nr:NERD domain-containing protein [Ornithinibacillus massiliensis]